MRFRLDRLDWKRLSEDRRLKLHIGMAVVLIIFFAFFIDIVFSVYKFKVYVEERPREKKTLKEKVRPPRRAKAEVAIILDDAGGNIPNYREICLIKEPLTISVLPHMASSSTIAEAMKRSGFEVMLHLPMEPENHAYVRSDGGMVVCDLSDEEIMKTVTDDLAFIKTAAGFNNHLGSKATKDERVMNAIFTCMKGKGLYFIDSRTSGGSLAGKIAKSFRIPSSDNNVFLDGVNSEAEIEGKFKYLVSIAELHGTAVGIGHATRVATINVLKKMMPVYARNGIKFVHASEIVK